MISRINEEKELKGLDWAVSLHGKESVLEKMRKWDRRAGKDFRVMLFDFIFKGLGGRKVLDPKVMELCAISTLVPIGVVQQIKSHIKGALHVGATEAEVCEAILQTVKYCGLPLMNQALAVYEEVIQEKREKK